MTRMVMSCLAVVGVVATLSLVAVADEEGASRNESRAEVQASPEQKPAGGARVEATELTFDDSRLARVQGRLMGPGQHQYTFNARKGQKVVLALSSERAPWIGMDLLAPVFAPTLKSAPPVYTNFIDGSTRWEGVAPGNGTYTVRLGLLNSQARKVGRVDYELDVNLK